MPAQDPVAIAEQLLQLVKTISESPADSLKVWNTKIEIQNACDSLLAKVLGPLEHTVLVAGTSTAIYSLFTSNNMPIPNRVLPRVVSSLLCHQPWNRRFHWRGPGYPP
jgi:hypothetical protein